MFSEIKTDEYYKLMVLLAIEFPSEKEKEEAREIVSRINVNKLYDCALEHDMESVIYPGLKELSDASLPDYWTKAYNDKLNKIEFLVNKLKEIADRLDYDGIPIVALKNGGIAAGLLSDKAKCPMGDIDTLVTKSDFFKAHNILIEMGYVFKFRSEFEEEILDKAFINGGTEYYLKDGSGNEIWFELSWRPIAGRWIRSDKEPDAAELIKRSRLIPDSKIRILAPEDNLLQVALHTAKHSYVREPGFRLHLDVERIVKYSKVDWERFYLKVLEMGTKTAVYYSLHIPKTLFNTPIPNHVLDRLRPNRIKDHFISAIIRRAKLLHPTENKFKKFEFLFLHFLMYDSPLDIFRVAFPTNDWMRKKYRYKYSLQYPYFLIIRVLDLMGYRTKKSSL